MKNILIISALALAGALAFSFASPAVALPGNAGEHYLVKTSSLVDEAISSKETAFMLIAQRGNRLGNAGPRMPAPALRDFSSGKPIPPDIKPGPGTPADVQPQRTVPLQVSPDRIRLLDEKMTDCGEAGILNCRER